MRTPQFALLSLAVAAALASNALAQGDDCGGALNILQGLNGPYTNVGSTTSTQVWPCATGGNDVWFSYVAPAAGTLTADTCGSGFDTALEIFDGTAGCGSLVSLLCNDDSCGLQSSVTVPVTSGTTYLIRVGGYNGATGSFSVNINGPLGTGQVVATATNYGAGCVAKQASFYEHFLTTPSIDLSNSAFQMINTGTGYLVLPSTAAFVAPSATATNLGLGDDAETTVTLSGTMPYPGGSTSSLNVCSNGHISTASNTASFDYTPTPGEFLNWANATWAVWRDFIPGTAGGAVKSEEVAGILYITWDAVVGYVGTAAGTTPSTFQLQFDLTSGNVTFVFLSMDTVSVSGWTGGEGWVVGYSPGGASLDGGSRDLTATIPGSFLLPGADLSAIAFAAGARPIGGTTIGLNTSNIGPTAPFGAVGLGFSNPALDLTGLGMAGCTQYTDNLVTLLFLPFGSPTASTAFAVPSAPFAIGVHILAQSFVYDPAANLTLVGALASNGIDLGIGNL